MLGIIVALGYGIVKSRLDPLKAKVLRLGLIYFGIATTETLLRLNTKDNEANTKVLVSRIALAVIDLTIQFWIFTGLVKTTRTLRLKKNVVK
jgi:Lung seven transmembrane receptor